MQVKDVLEKILNIEMELEALNASFVDWAEEYQGKEFPEQMGLAVCLENTMQMVTHETATVLGFARSTIEQLTLFIEFRKRWQQFSDDELVIILDSDMVPAAVKKELTSTGRTSKMTTELRLDWNILFSNKSYSKIKGQFLSNDTNISTMKY